MAYNDGGVMWRYYVEQQLESTIKFGRMRASTNLEHPQRYFCHEHFGAGDRQQNRCSIKTK